MFCPPPQILTTGLQNWGYMLGGRPSAADSHESKRIRADSARIRRPSARRNFQRTPPNVRRMFGGFRRTPPESAGICAESAANWRSCSLQKCPQEKVSKNYCRPRKNFRRGRSSAADHPRTAIGLGLRLG